MLISAPTTSTGAVLRSHRSPTKIDSKSSCRVLLLSAKLDDAGASLDRHVVSPCCIITLSAFVINMVTTFLGSGRVEPLWQVHT